MTANFYIVSDDVKKGNKTLNTPITKTVHIIENCTLSNPVIKLKLDGDLISCNYAEINGLSYFINNITYGTGVIYLHCNIDPYALCYTYRNSITGTIIATGNTPTNITDTHIKMTDDIIEYGIPIETGLNGNIINNYILTVTGKDTVQNGG